MTTRPKRPLPFVLLSAGLLLVGTLIVSSPLASADDKPAAATVTLPDDATQAWAEVQAGMKELQQKARAAQQNPKEAQKIIAEAYGPVVDKALAFAAKFPKDENAGQARQMGAQGLAFLSNSDPARKAQLDKFLDATIADTSLADDDRASMFVTKQTLGAKPTSQAHYQKLQVDALLAAKKEFPKSKFVYAQLLSIARNQQAQQPDEAKAIAKEIVAAEYAPADIKQTAQDIVDGKKPYELGKPLDIKFTAVDGREVDLSKMKGKVVLIDFWATWCGPCVQEIPSVKKTYDKLHPKGFEIVGISFDKDKDALVNFVKAKDMPWVQYFDGKFWKNDYGVRYGINGIPTMWLVDKDGNLADLNGREGLEQKVEKLLAAKTLQ